MKPWRPIPDHKPLYYICTVPPSEYKRCDPESVEWSVRQIERTIAVMSREATLSMRQHG